LKNSGTCLAGMRVGAISSNPIIPVMFSSRLGAILKSFNPIIPESMDLFVRIDRVRKKNSARKNTKFGNFSINSGCCHCERSEAISFMARRLLRRPDKSGLLAMTGRASHKGLPEVIEDLRISLITD
jgi:hypothetical protein